MAHAQYSRAELPLEACGSSAFTGIELSHFVWLFSSANCFNKQDQVVGMHTADVFLLQAKQSVFFLF